MYRNIDQNRPLFKILEYRSNITRKIEQLTLDNVNLELYSLKFSSEGKYQSRTYLTIRAYLKKYANLKVKGKLRLGKLREITI